MGQKTHPGGFRLNTTQEHYSNWYQKSWVSYSENLERDDKIRTLLKQKLPLTSVAKITIKQDYYPKMLNINVFVDKPILPLKMFETSDFEKQVQSIINTSMPYGINLYSISEPDANASILGDYIVDMLTKRVSFKRAVRRAIEIAKQNEFVQGIKIQISGRLNGAEIARSEWIKNGRMPLQTLRAEILYVSKQAKTTYGILGVKVWIFKGEQLK
jgi:small subunit ribosomal protein S3